MPETNIKYRKSPLINVIFQLRFPTILKIISKSPDEFQDNIKDLYPYCDQILEPASGFYIPDGRQISATQQYNYEFSSPNHPYRINLTSNFIALSTRNYTSWEDFRNEIAYMVNAFDSLYNPGFYMRCGLRYQNILTRSYLSLESSKWSELVNPQLLGVIADESIGEPQTYMSDAEFKKDDGFSVKTHFEIGHVNGNDEISLLMDFDHFKTASINPADIFSIAENLHEQSSVFFQNAITVKLHNAMEPNSIHTSTTE